MAMKWTTCTAEVFANEDWMFNHYRYKFSNEKLDTDLFEVREGALMKIGGTGRLEFGSIEYLHEIEKSFKTKNMKSGIELIAAEREEQLGRHGRTVEKDVKENNEGQLKHIEYSSVPVQEGKSKEEILNDTYIVKTGWSFDHTSIPQHHKDNILAAMEEYANQFKSPVPVSVGYGYVCQCADEQMFVIAKNIGEAIVIMENKGYKGFTVQGKSTIIFMGK